MAYPTCERCGKQIGQGDKYTSTGVLPRRAWHRRCFDAEPCPLTTGEIYRLHAHDGQYLPMPAPK